MHVSPPLLSACRPRGRRKRSGRHHHGRNTVAAKAIVGNRDRETASASGSKIPEIDRVKSIAKLR